MGQTTHFQTNIATALYIREYTYNLSQLKFKYLPSKTTSFSSKRLYSYLEQPTKWKLKNQEVSLDTYQFLEHYSYLTGEMIEQLNSTRLRNGTDLNL